MKSGEAIKKAMEECGMTQETMATKMGYKGQAAIGNSLARGGMRVDKFVKMAQLMGYEVVLRRGKNEIEVTE